MKKKGIIIICSIVAVLAIVGVAIFLNVGNREIIDKLSSDHKRVIAESSYANAAWGFIYEGMAICNDGSIVDFIVTGNDVEKPYGDMNAKSEWILRNGEMRTEKVSSGDLETINYYMNTLEDSIRTKNVGCDMGSYFTSIYDYEEGKEITLEEIGDNKGKNNSWASRKILNIIEKYKTEQEGKV